MRRAFKKQYHVIIFTGKTSTATAESDCAGETGGVIYLFSKSAAGSSGTPDTV